MNETQDMTIETIKELYRQSIIEKEEKRKILMNVIYADIDRRIKIYIGHKMITIRSDNFDGMMRHSDIGYDTRNSTSIDEIIKECVHHYTSIGLVAISSGGDLTIKWDHIVEDV